MEFKWLNESSIKHTGNRIEILAPARTDFFCGSTGLRVYENLSIEKRTVKNIRAGK